MEQTFANSDFRVSILCVWAILEVLAGVGVGLKIKFGNIVTHALTNDAYFVLFTGSVIIPWLCAYNVLNLGMFVQIIGIIFTVIINLSFFLYDFNYLRHIPKWLYVGSRVLWILISLSLAFYCLSFVMSLR